MPLQSVYVCVCAERSARFRRCVATARPTNRLKPKQRSKLPKTLIPITKCTTKKYNNQSNTHTHTPYKKHTYICTYIHTYVQTLIHTYLCKYTSSCEHICCFFGELYFKICREQTNNLALMITSFTTAPTIQTTSAAVTANW